MHKPLSNFVALPGNPHHLEVVSVSETWISIRWQHPDDVGSHGISYYSIVVYQRSNGTVQDSVSMLSTQNNITQWNITGLFPGTVVQIQVGAVSTYGDVIATGPFSNTLETQLNTTGNREC